MLKPFTHLHFVYFSSLIIIARSTVECDLLCILESKLRGLEVLVKTMTRHEVALFFIRSDYTCGLIPDVPTNFGLILKVKLLDFFGKLKELVIKFCADHQR